MVGVNQLINSQGFQKMVNVEVGTVVNQRVLIARKIAFRTQLRLSNALNKLRKTQSSPQSKNFTKNTCILQLKPATIHETLNIILK